MRLAVDGTVPTCPPAFAYTSVMIEPVIIPIQSFDSEGQVIPLSAINQYLYCPRRAALIHVEGTFTDNEHTLIGSQFHEQADVPGYEKAAGTEVLRALPVWSRRLGLSGKCDIVEVKLKSRSKLKKISISPGNINCFYPVNTKRANGANSITTTLSYARKLYALKRCSGWRFPEGLSSTPGASAAGKLNLPGICAASPNRPSKPCIG